MASPPTRRDASDLPCGGTIQLVLEPLTRESGMRALLREVESGHLVARRLDLGSGFATLHPARAADGLAFDGKMLTTIHGPRYRMLVIGASQLSKYLAQIAVGLDYQVTICDPREEYTETWDIPGVTLVRTMPDDTALAMKLDERCAVVALTHDPKLDDLALMEALKSPGVLRRRAGLAREQQQTSRTPAGIRRQRRADRSAAWTRSASTSAAARLPKSRSPFWRRSPRSRTEYRRATANRWPRPKERLGPSVACSTT